MTTLSQNAMILADLKAGKTVTPLDALKRYGCLRLSGRIFDLRQDGHPIQMTWATSGDKRFARYSLPKRKRAA